MKFSIKDFLSKCDQIRSFLWIWSHLLKKSLMENITFLYSVITAYFVENATIQHLVYFHFVMCTILREFNKKYGWFYWKHKWKQAKELTKKPRLFPAKNLFLLTKKKVKLLAQKSCHYFTVRVKSRNKKWLFQTKQDIVQFT